MKRIFGEIMGGADFGGRGGGVISPEGGGVNVIWGEIK